MEILKTAYSQVKTKFQSAISTLETVNFLGVNDYDHAFRLTEVHHQVGANPEVLMVALEYNELGQLIKKKLNENADGSFLQEVDFTYNIRGWLTSINDPEELQKTGEPKDMFAMQLHYTDILPTVNNTGDEQYNGNIAAIKWNSSEFGVKAYGYGYDEINRLERAKFAAGAALNIDVDKYSVENITYDANGNILTLGRHNTATGYIDNLTMTYDGNQLKKTHDSGDLALGFVDGVDTETEYHYDHNGNMDVDDNKGFAFAYNYMSLPKEIVGGNDTVRYIYDANGVKVSKELAKGGSVSYTDYVRNFVYKDGELDYILMKEGRITQPIAGVIQYEYFLKDHLGSTRTVFADGNGDGLLVDNEVLQEAHYYPYGMSIGDLAVDRGVDNKIKYYGKELQDDALNGVKLNLYDYGRRYYMPDVPVFTTADPLTERFSSQSPYLYAYNNPVRFTDFKGMNAEDKVKKEDDPPKKKVKLKEVVYKQTKKDKKALRKYKQAKRKIKRFNKNGQGKTRKATRLESWIVNNCDGEELNNILNALFGTDGDYDGYQQNTVEVINGIVEKNYSDTEFDYKAPETTNGENITDNTGKVENIRVSYEPKSHKGPYNDSLVEYNSSTDSLYRYFQDEDSTRVSTWNENGIQSTVVKKYKGR